MMAKKDRKGMQKSLAQTQKIHAEGYREWVKRGSKIPVVGQSVEFKWHEDRSGFVLSVSLSQEGYEAAPLVIVAAKRKDKSYSTILISCLQITKYGKKNKLP